MKTYISDLIPKIERFSQKLDDLTKLKNQHWVALDEISNSKNTYIFRDNNELLISQNGKVEKAKWEYLENNSLLIERKDDIYLFKHGFLDENILALKIDSNNEYALLINETKYEGELNSIERIVDFLSKKYLEPISKGNIEEFIKTIHENTEIVIGDKTIWLDTDKGKLEIRTQDNSGCIIGDLVFLDGIPAPNGKYIYGRFSWFHRIIVENGKILFQ